MSTKDNVLRLLQQSDSFLSGQQIADTLGVSRNAVWKAIKTLQLADFNITSHAHLGYRLLSAPLTLDQHAIATQLPHDTVFVYDSIDSTNAQAKRYVPNLTTKRALFIASEQSDGRGRYARSFYSPKGSGMYFSVLLKTDFPIEHGGLITALSAVAVARAIKQHLSIDLSIKWVNDLFLNDKKVCGILTEAITNIETGQIDHIIIGIGMNLHEPDVLPDELKHIIGYISQQRVDMNQLVVSIVTILQQLLDALPDTSFMDEYRERCFILQRQITVHPLASEPYTATALAITDQAHLVVKKENNQEEILHFGEVSLKLN